MKGQGIYNLKCMHNKWGAKDLQPVLAVQQGHAPQQLAEKKEKRKQKKRWAQKKEDTKPSTRPLRQLSSARLGKILNLCECCLKDTAHCLPWQLWQLWQLGLRSLCFGLH